MITIKKGDRGWENPENWEDVESLPGFVKDIDPREVELDAVIGKYREPELRVCGFSTCRTKHFRGYIASTKDGRVTNIGVDCGKKHFGVDFETMSRQLDRDWQNQQRRLEISAAQNMCDGWIIKCSNLINGDRAASWINRQYRLIIDREDGLPPSVSQDLLKLIKSGDNVLYRERTATEQEKDIARETGQQQLEIIREEIGSIQGIKGLGLIEELRNILPKDLELNLKNLSEIDVNKCTDTELRYWAKWSGEVESKFTRATMIIEDARKFFNQDNITLLSEIALNRKDEKKVMLIAKKYK
ncbi:MAG: hypothetical protein AB2687_09720 [Candidatus Thiodiazotropha taylori]